MRPIDSQLNRFGKRRARKAVAAGMAALAIASALMLLAPSALAPAPTAAALAPAPTAAALAPAPTAAASTLEAGGADDAALATQAGGADDAALATQAGGDVVEMHRLYNPNTGEHFYTADEAERDNLKGLGWRYEGCGWVAPKRSDFPVFRLYSGTDHHYTTDVAERDELVDAGWEYEGVGWYSKDDRLVPMHRLYNPNVNPQDEWFNSGAHHYTTDAAERDELVDAGWTYEGIAWGAVRKGEPAGDWVSALSVAGSVDQIIAVEAWGLQATVSMHEKTDGVWRETLSTTEGWVGKNGIGSARAGIAHTPTGVMYPTEAFGILADPGCPMGYLEVDWSHWWCGDSESPLYNLMVSTRDTTDFNMYDSEHIISCGATYNYCLNMGWNIERTPYGGSAFFLHCSQGKPTDGCVTVPEPLMIRILQAIRPGCAIVIDTPSGIMQY